MSLAPNLDLLALGSHPDDVEFSCGGWLAHAVASEQSVGLLDLTRGELASNGTPELRAKEAAAAAEILGVKRWNLELPDGGLDDTDSAQIAELVRAIRQHRPRLLLAPWTQARHPDHAAAGRLAQRAVFFAGVRKYAPNAGAPYRPERLIYYPQRRELRPSFVVDISAVRSVKSRAIACHGSQVDPSHAEMEMETLVNQPLGRAAFAIRDAYWGATIGVLAGEPYMIDGPVPVADPITHFTAHAERPVLIA